MLLKGNLDRDAAHLWAPAGIDPEALRMTGGRMIWHLGANGMECSDYIGETPAPLSPVVFSSAVRTLRAAASFASALSEDEEVDLFVDAEERGVVLTVQVVGYSLADQRDLQSW